MQMALELDPKQLPGSMEFHVARLLFGILCIMVFGLLTFMALDYHRATDDEFGIVNRGKGYGIGNRRLDESCAKVCRWES